MFNRNEKFTWEPKPSMLKIKWNNPLAILLAMTAFFGLMQTAEAVAPFTKLYKVIYDRAQPHPTIPRIMVESPIFKTREEAINNLKAVMFNNNSVAKVENASILETDTTTSKLTSLTEAEQAYISSSPSP